MKNRFEIHVNGLTVTVRACRLTQRANGETVRDVQGVAQIKFLADKDAETWARIFHRVCLRLYHSAPAAHAPAELTFG